MLFRRVVVHPVSPVSAFLLRVMVYHPGVISALGGVYS